MYDPFAFNLRHLRAMTTVVRLGSLSAAAQEVGITQPALTAAIAGLERQLGALFLRSRAGMAATPAGAMLAARVEEAYAHLAAGLSLNGPANRGFSKPEQLITTAQLRALLALADQGSYVASAQQTGLSEPALHRSVRDIERLTGTALVKRRGRGVALTPAGRSAARAFRFAFRALRSGLAELAALADADAPDRLVVGAMPLCRARLLPAAVALLQARHPSTHITIVEGAHRVLMEQLRDGHIDMAIGALRNPPPGPDVVQSPLLEDRLAIIAGGGHPLAGPKLPPLEELAGYRWLVGLPGSPLRQHWDEMFASGPRPPSPVDCGSVMVLRWLLTSGDYLTLLSPEQVGMELETGRLAMVGPPLDDHVRSIGVTVRRDWRPTATQGYFLSALRNVVS
ncbi:LysR family transcriptional regulator [Sphingomonas sp. ASY06-1R]|uniref:LysR family transcriptional regulator n=1 Tax=Sphingomonas sp. ASY06-1R TaxID=3445771 RepID=UPI003FA2604F